MSEKVTNLNFQNIKENEMKKAQFRRMNKLLFLFALLGFVFLGTQTINAQGKGGLGAVNRMGGNKSKNQPPSTSSQKTGTANKSSVALGFSLYFTPQSIYRTRKMQAGQKGRLEVIASGGKKPYKYRWFVAFFGNNGRKLSSLYGGTKFTTVNAIPLEPRRAGKIMIEVTIEDDAGNTETAQTEITVVD
jgi:hypothetical protein